ncbi:MAG: hypothetical protein JNM78_03960 [Cyclobacteriaceae bacterium]|nr:hypothetical protein [Cyclobacteriaceae bacterium]
MKNKYLFFLLLLGVLSCTDNQVDEIAIRRNGLVEFSLDNIPWRASSFQLINIGEVVVFEDPSNVEGTIYQRLFFLIKGHNEKGGDRKLTVIFDLPVSGRLLGKASLAYSQLNGGIKSVEFSDQAEGHNSPFKLYTLAIDETAEVFIDVQRQSLQDKIVAGVFKLVLTDVTDPANKISLNEGVFKDIPYTEL